MTPEEKTKLTEMLTTMGFDGDSVDRMEKLHNDMQTFIEEFKKTKEGKKISYDVMASLFYLLKIAKLEIDVGAERSRHRLYSMLTKQKTETDENKT